MWHSKLLPGNSFVNAGLSLLTGSLSKWGLGTRNDSTRPICLCHPYVIPYVIWLGSICGNLAENGVGENHDTIGGKNILARWWKIPLKSEKL